jgi:hypothetical protein
MHLISEPDGIIIICMAFVPKQTQRVKCNGVWYAVCDVHANLGRVEVLDPNVNPYCNNGQSRLFFSFSEIEDAQ